jgi:hypothetical protein
MLGLQAYFVYKKTVFSALEVVFFCSLALFVVLARAPMWPTARHG